jgi:hypothetical protein
MASVHLTLTRGLIDDRGMATYFTNCGPESGPILDRDFPFAIGVLAEGELMPVGMALGAGRTEDGLAIWRLTVHDADLPGRWIIVDREFRPDVAGGADRTGSADLSRSQVGGTT